MQFPKVSRPPKLENVMSIQLIRATLGKTALLAAASFFLLALPTLQAGTIFGGLEDTHPNGDNDYNDLIYSLTGDLAIQSATGAMQGNPVLGIGGLPYWNNASMDGSNAAQQDTYNLGYCLYGGGACNGGTALAVVTGPLDYYANSNGSAPTDIDFASSGAITASLLMRISGDQYVTPLFWYDPSDPTLLHQIFSPSASAGAVVSFTPSSTFGLAYILGSGASCNYATGNGCSYNVNGAVYSQSSLNGAPKYDWQGFALFEDPPLESTPEPAGLPLIALGLTGIGVARRKSQAFSA